MLRDVKVLASPELDAFHEQIDIRSRSFRVSFFRGRNVASDYGLVERTSPFIHRLHRPQVSILLEGQSRFEEEGRRAWPEASGFVVSDPRRAGTEAYAGLGSDGKGGPSAWLVVQWDPATMGGPVSAPFSLERFSERERLRFLQHAKLLKGPSPAQAMSEIAAMIRSLGVGIGPVTAADIEVDQEPSDVRLHEAMSAQLSNLEGKPAIEDLVATLDWNTRRVNRRIRAIADDYCLPWSNWRGALRHARLLQIFRMLSAPGATTERVAKLTGFRSPTALCHVLANVGLPSAGILARAARRDVLDAWSAFVPAASEEHAPEMEEKASGWR